MNREIKFRGKEATTGEWKYGSLYVGQMKHGEEYALILTCNCDEELDENIDAAISFRYDETYPVVSPTIGQFTGLHDSRGVEVYEFDIIKDEGSELLYVMYFSEKDLRFVRCPIVYFTKAHEDEKEYHSCAPTLEWWNRIKRYVVGNIHDNPELFKEEQQ